MHLLLPCPYLPWQAALLYGMEESLQELLMGSFERKAGETPSVLREYCCFLGRKSCTHWGPLKTLFITAFTSQQAPVTIQGEGSEVLVVPLLIYPSP